MAVAALIDLGGDVEKLNEALESLNLEDEFTYKISDVSINSIRAKDFDVILPENHTHSDIGHHGHKHSHSHLHSHRNLEDVNKIIDGAKASDSAKNLAKNIFRIVAEAEACVHGLNIDMVHFHEVGAIDSIADIVAFAVLYDSLNLQNSASCASNSGRVYFSTLNEGQGFVKCQHGVLPVPVPAVCEIVRAYDLPICITENPGEMVTPTGAAIVAALYSADFGPNSLPESFRIKKIGYGAGKRKYKNPLLRVMQLEF